MTSTPSPDSIYRFALGRLAKGVAVVSTVWDGVDYAMTVDSLTSVSLEPLLVLVCVENDARFLGAVATTGWWGASILAEPARPAADWFATRGRPLAGQFGAVAHHREEHGIPLLDQSLATLVMQTEQIHPAGDHSIVVGRVHQIDLPDEDGPALVFYRGRYTSLP